MPIRLNTAVVLLARKEKDSDIPYPLRPFVSDQCLLDRTLELLRSLEFSKIILVVGFRSELFASYAAEDVEIVKSDVYRFSSSMASLAAAAPYVTNDFLLIEGDTFYERAVLESLSLATSPNCLAIADESGSGDEAFVEVNQGFITKISKDKHQISSFSGELLGILKLSYETYQRMLQKWSKSSNPYLNYEYLFLDTTSVLERPYLYFKDLIWGDVDTEEDLQRLINYIYPRLNRRENPFDRENIIRVFQTTTSDPSDADSIEVMKLGGMSNMNFKVSTPASEYVLRLPGLGSSGMIQRSDEEQNSIRAHALGINPPILYFNAETGVKLTQFIPDAETLNGATLQRPDNLEQIAHILCHLHSSKVRFNNDFNVFSEIIKYEALYFGESECLFEQIEYPEYSKYRERIMTLEADLDRIGIVVSPCHNDLVAENFIKSRTQEIYLIDWEYSGMNDPMWDLAALFLESTFSEESQSLFLKHYFKDREEYTLEVQRIKIYQILMDWLWSIWTLVKQKEGMDFGSYGIDRYNRAIAQLEQLQLC